MGRGGEGSDGTRAKGGSDEIKEKRKERRGREEKKSKVYKLTSRSEIPSVRRNGERRDGVVVVADE